MRRTEFTQRDFFGGHLDCITYETIKPCTKWAVFHPGTGEMGQGDGTQLYDLDKYGFCKRAKAGEELPFNIIAIQPANSYSGPIKIILPWVKMELNPSGIIPLGISLGAIACLDELTKDEYNLITGVVSLSGKPSGGTAAIPRMRAVPGYAYHGMKDVTIDFATAQKFFLAYNAAMKNTNTGFVLDFNPNQAHGGWDDVMAAGGALEHWMTQIFGPEKLNDYDTGVIDGLNIAAKLALTEISERAIATAP